MRLTNRPVTKRHAALLQELYDRPIVVRDAAPTLLAALALIACLVALAGK
jgi:hypothetical protein